MPRFNRKQEVLCGIDNRNSILLSYGIQPPLSKAQSVSSFGDVENTKTTFTVSESITKLINENRDFWGPYFVLPSPDEDKKVIAALHMGGAEIRRLIALLRRSQSFRATWVEVSNSARGVASETHLQKGRRLEGMIVEDLYNQTGKIGFDLYYPDGVCTSL